MHSCVFWQPHHTWAVLGSIAECSVAHTEVARLALGESGRALVGRTEASSLVASITADCAANLAERG